MPAVTAGRGRAAEGGRWHPLCGVGAGKAGGWAAAPLAPGLWSRDRRLGSSPLYRHASPGARSGLRCKSGSAAQLPVSSRGSDGSSTQWLGP